MKPAKKTAPLPFPANKITLKNILKKTGLTAKSAVGAKNASRKFFVIPAEEVSARDRARLLRQGFCVRSQDNLLQRLSYLEKENRHLKTLSIRDELTGLYNKRFFNAQLKVEISRANRTGEPFCLILIDLDNFKIVNDTLGHPKGDEFLIKMCRRMSSRIRPTDFACRFGGDEFAVILPATSLRDGIKIAERWHHNILQVAAGMRLPVSASIGVDEFNASGKLDAQRFIHQVDQRLYQAKKTGKGRIVHPDIGQHDDKSVTWAEKEVLYHIFQPRAQKTHIPKKDRGNK